MIRRAFIIILFAAIITDAEEEGRVLTRDEIFARPVLPERSPTKYYTEVDLNGDDIDDLLFSESISLGGTGGLMYHIYLGVGDNEFKRAYYQDSRQRKSWFTANMMALEIEQDSPRRRLWIYSHGSARSGSVAYLYFNPKGDLAISRHITIHTSVEGSELGDEILNTIFRGGDRLIETIPIEVPVITAVP